MDAEDQRGIDATLIELDGTPNKGRLGANAILGVSLAVAKAAAEARGLPLYRYVGGVSAHVLPVPMMNIINGGAHADNPIDFQEFMIMPVGAETLAEAVRIGSEVFHTLKKALKDAGHNTNVGDEGGFAPNLAARRRGARLHHEARSRRPATSRATTSCSALDCAATEFFKGGKYDMAGEGKTLDPPRWPNISPTSSTRYPDHLDRGRHGGGRLGRLEGADRALGDTVQLVGDDLFVTNTERLREGIGKGVANSILVKVNQIGTLTETLDAVEMAHARRLHRGDVPPLRRDRGLDHRRPRRRHQLRPDQDRLAVPLGPAREVQPADPHRGGARRRGGLRRTFDLKRASV